MRFSSDERDAVQNLQGVTKYGSSPKKLLKRVQGFKGSRVWFLNSDVRPYNISFGNPFVTL